MWHRHRVHQDEGTVGGLLESAVFHNGQGNDAAQRRTQHSDIGIFLWQAPMRMEAADAVELLGVGKAPHEVLVAVEARRGALLRQEAELMRWAAALEAQVHALRFLPPPVESGLHR